MLIGNLTRDPELRYTPGGMAVASFGLATNRVWVTKQGERKEDAQFHRIVAWNKLAELCSQLLSKGRRVYVDGRIQYREYNDQENNKKQIAEIVIDDMVILDNKGNGSNADHDDHMIANFSEEAQPIAAEEVAGVIDDIIIPDDVVETAPVEAPVEIPVDAPVEEVPVTEKKDEEIPF